MASKKNAQGVNKVLVGLLIIFGLIIGILFVNNLNTTKVDSIQATPDEIALPTNIPTITPTPAPAETREDRIQKCKDEAQALWQQEDNRIKSVNSSETEACKNNWGNKPDASEYYSTYNMCLRLLAEAVNNSIVKNKDVYNARITACMTVN